MTLEIVEKQVVFLLYTEAIHSIVFSWGKFPYHCKFTVGFVEVNMAGFLPQLEKIS